MKINQTLLSGVHDVNSHGEPFIWGMGGALVLGIVMIGAFLWLVLQNGISVFYPNPIHQVTLYKNRQIAGEPVRSELFRPSEADMDKLPQNIRQKIEANNGFAERTLYKTGNYDLNNDDFKWVADYEVKEITLPKEIYYIERREWGPFVGFIKSMHFRGKHEPFDISQYKYLVDRHAQITNLREKISKIEKSDIGIVNYYMEKNRLSLRKLFLKYGNHSKQYRDELFNQKKETDDLQREYQKLLQSVNILKQENERYSVVLADVNGTEKEILLSDIVRFYPANSLSFWNKMSIYFSRWLEFLVTEPREANTEGGVFPAIFGTFIMTVLLVILVAPFGVIASLYLREYAKQGRLVSIIRICVNNLAGVPSIVYGIFGLGFFAYIVGGSIDQFFFPERLPNPTFGTGGLLWASLTLALLTVPVVIVATEEALSAVPQSLREGSLACGASKWQTIRNIVLPKAAPGILTGLILAMARGAGEVAPLMLVGVVKLAPELPMDGIFPFLHLERSFMHLGFHIFDVGFQSRNSEAGKPMVFVTTLLLIFFIAVMNGMAIYIRNRLNRKYATGHF